MSVQPVGRISLVAAIIVPLLVAMSCSRSEQSDLAETDAPGDEASSVGANATAAIREHCFRNEYPFPDDPDTKDVEELLLEVDGDEVAGSYSWLPAFKDQRVGDLQGTMEGLVVSASYTFMQEGQAATAEIAITLEERRAIVEAASPELGLDASIDRVECRN